MIHLLLFLTVLTGCVAGQASPDLILAGGKIWTGDPERREVAALAVANDRILAVGTSAEILSLRGKDTRVIDLAGRRLVPGFIDSHVHFLGGGDELLGADLRHAETMEAFAEGLRAVAAKQATGTWITSGTWDHERWPGAPLPTRQVIDRFVPEHPVFVTRLDGHMAVANTRALKLAALTKETSDPAGGTIVREPDGTPTGVLKDTAMSLVQAHVPSWNPSHRRERALASLAHAASLGVTGVHDMGVSAATLRIYQELRDEGKLTCRITAYVPMGSLVTLRQAGLTRGFGDGSLKINGFKAFVDGSLGSTTALFFEPYDDAPDTRGLPVIAIGKNGPLDRQVAAALRDGLQPAIHAIGDRANRALLDIYARSVAGLDADALSPRCRIEHAQHLHPDDIPRFKNLGVVASMQPYHVIDDGRWCEKRIGRERSQSTYPFRDLLDSGAHLAFGSDWPVAPLSPILGIYAAVTRRTLDGAHPEGWIPEQRISVEEALRAYTHGSSHAAFDEDTRGKLAPGWLADLVVLDRDLLALNGDDLRDVQVDMTIVGGRVVYERKPIHHIALITLKDPTDAPKLMAACRALGHIPHVLSLEIGGPAEGERGPPVDATYHVALVMKFASAQTLAFYVKDTAHASLSETWMPKIASLRVFDIEPVR